MELSGKRLMRAVTFWLVAVVLLAPALLQMLPSPVSAEEAALWRDLQINRCLEQKQPMQDKHEHKCDHCVLCAPQPFPKAAFEPDPLSEPVRLARQTAKVAFVFLHLSRAQPHSLTAPITGRGPPA